MFLDMRGMFSLISLVGPTILTALTVTYILYSIIKVRILRRAYTPLPGPKQYPLVGRIHDLPLRGTWFKFKEWADEYGPIYLTTVFGVNFLVISDETIVEDLLVKRAKMYSDRPAMPSVVDSKSTNGSMEYLPLMGKNKYWSRQRKWAHAALTQAADTQYQNILSFEVKRLLFELTTHPDDVQFLLEDMASRITCTLAWGDPTLSKQNTENARALLTQISPSDGPITNLVTQIWHLPYWVNPWKWSEKVRHDALHAHWIENLDAVSKNSQTGMRQSCWAQRFLDEKQTSLSGDVEASCCIGMLALVGVLTVGGPLQYFLIAMLHHPIWLRKCQEEVDKVCKEGMPELADAPNLPILRACIKETMRWRPNVPTGVAHELVGSHDVYRDFFIPKGTLILPLEWAFLRDIAKYPDPENYRPERWLEAGWPTYRAPLTQFPTIKGMSSFGWGQRTCVGQSLTESELLLACGSICWGFDLDFKTSEKTGRKIEVPTDKSNDLLIIKPEKFEIMIRPRSGAKALEIVEQWNQAATSNPEARI